jgi:hypothetical protein
MKTGSRPMWRGAGILIALTLACSGSMALAAPPEPVLPASPGAAQYAPRPGRDERVPPIRAIGALHSTNPRQSSAILQINRDAPLDFAEGQAVVGAWSVKRIRSDSVEITDGSRVLWLPVVGGDARPALLPQSKPRPERLDPASPAGGDVSAQIMRDAARRRAIHALRTD